VAEPRVLSPRRAGIYAQRHKPGRRVRQPALQGLVVLVPSRGGTGRTFSTLPFLPGLISSTSFPLQ